MKLLPSAEIEAGRKSSSFLMIVKSGAFLLMFLERRPERIKAEIVPDLFSKRNLLSFH